MPSKLALISDKEYMFALSFVAKGNSFLRLAPINFWDEIQYKDKHFIKNNVHLDNNGITKLCDEMDTDISIIDLRIVRVIYSAILKKIEEEYIDYNEELYIYVPDLLQVLGKKRNLSEKQLCSFVEKVNNLKYILSYTKIESDNRYKYSPMFEFINYDSQTNIISFKSPVLIWMAKLLIDKKEKEKKSTHSYIICAGIGKEKNLAATENVCRLSVLIEMAGKYNPHISLERLISENCYLNSSINNASSKNKQKIINRVFSKTWELLDEYTEIKEVYKNIKLPDKNYIPRYASKKEEIISFPNNGKYSKP